MVVYPAKTRSANGLKCWNWFKASDQKRGRGEPAIIAGITRELIANHGLDANRLYVAGHSAGGAMAVVLGRTYPDLYAAVGMHSGIPYAIAHDAPSAFSAMQGSTTLRIGSDPIIPRLIPTIVIHGDRDQTVHPRNGGKLAKQFSNGTEVENCALVQAQPGTVSDQQGARGGRTYTLTMLRDTNRKVVVEYWLVHGAGHAWFGGNPAGSHTDAKGPDASKEILRFFLEHGLHHRRIS